MYHITFGAFFKKRRQKTYSHRPVGLTGKYKAFHLRRRECPAGGNRHELNCIPGVFEIYDLAVEFLIVQRKNDVEGTFSGSELQHQTVVCPPMRERAAGRCAEKICRSEFPVVIQHHLPEIDVGGNDFAGGFGDNSKQASTVFTDADDVSGFVHFDLCMQNKSEQADERD